VDCSHVAPIAWVNNVNCRGICNSFEIKSVVLNNENSCRRDVLVISDGIIHWFYSYKIMICFTWSHIKFVCLKSEEFKGKISLCFKIDVNVLLIYLCFIS
jgi:hypothetical protein